MLTTLEKWVETTPWAMVVAVNQSMCEGKENAPHRPGKGFEAARQLWESAVPRPMKLREALDLCRECHALAPFDFFNGNTMAAISRKMVESFLQRLVRAAANPHVCVIGHPTGRIVPSRRGLEPDMQKVIFAAARNGIALEINANCYRLDLRDTHVKMAVDANVPICINTDAHGIPDFDQMIYGVLTARRGWATAAHILNARPLAEFKSWLKGRKEAAAW